MIEVFTTNAKDLRQTEVLLRDLKNSFPDLEFNVDPGDGDLSYPCGHSILRAEGPQMNSKHIIAVVEQSGFMGDVLEDKVCNS